MRRLFIVAGETSGDRHAAALIAELHRREPLLTIAGLGGPQMRAAGAILLTDLTRHAVVGTVEVLRHLGTLRRLYAQAAGALDRDRPDAVLLVDYPGFNLRFAREAKRRGLPVIYYVSPQLWAWGAGRIRTIRRLVNLMLVFFPFEEQLYRQAGVPVQWVGHPLVETARVTHSRVETLRQYGFPTDQPLIALLPGSREGEVQQLLPILANAAERLAGRLTGVRFPVLQAPGISPSIYRQAVEGAGAACFLVPSWDENLLAACDLALVASGTATLECALLNVPMVIVYRTNAVTWWLGRRLVTLPDIGLVNVVAGRRLVPECLQHHATPERITEETLGILQSAARRQEMLAGFEEVRSALGTPGATARAATAILTFLKTPTEGVRPL